MTVVVTFRSVDRDRIARAIAEAEARTTGEIVVSLAPFFIGSVERAAERAWARLGVSRTRDRNGVLLFVVPSRRQLVVRGDVAIHEKVGFGFWDEVARAVTQRLAGGATLTDAVVTGIRMVGDALATHFPAGVGERNQNELSDEVDVP